MRYLLPLIAAAMLVWYALADAQICPATPEGYTRQHRPTGEPANYPPAEEPACFMMDTQADSRIPGCIQCHGGTA